MKTPLAIWPVAMVAGFSPLSACAAEPEPMTMTPVAAVEVDSEADGVDLFTEVLAQHQALNGRVERVAHQLLTRNAGFCERTRRTAGLSVHTLSDYPEALRPLAMNLLGVDEGLSIRSVVEGGPADRAGVEPGDAVRAVGGMPIADNMTAIRYWDIAQDRIAERARVDFGLTRDGMDVSANLAMQDACDVDVVVQFSEVPNAYTDGQELVITSELVRRSPSDSRLALILAHELAHVIAHAGVFDGSEEGGQELEFDADAKGLALLANAGFSMDDAIADMEAFSRGVVSKDGPTHPAHARRVKTLRDLQSEIEAKMEAGEPLILGDFGLN